jgi:hypothetical protein
MANTLLQIFFQFSQGVLRHMLLDLIWQVVEVMLRERRGSRPLAMAMARLCRGVTFSRRRRLEFVFLDLRGLSRGFACTSGFS